MKWEPGKTIREGSKREEKGEQKESERIAEDKQKGSKIGATGDMKREQKWSESLAKPLVEAEILSVYF